MQIIQVHFSVSALLDTPTPTLCVSTGKLEWVKGVQLPFFKHKTNQLLSTEGEVEPKATGQLADPPPLQGHRQLPHVRLRAKGSVLFVETGWLCSTLSWDSLC